MKNHNLLIAIACMALSLNAFAQEDILPDEIHKILELYTQQTDEEDVTPDHLENLYDHYFNLSRNPVYLNLANRDDLEELYVLTDFQIHSLLKYREEYGPILSIHELSLIVGFNDVLVASIQPFISIEEVKEEEKRSKRLRQEIIVRGQRQLEAQQGYRDNTYLSDRNKVYLRYQAKKQDQFSYGITLEKDPGEYYWNAEYLEKTDFLAGHVAIYEKGPIQSFIIGDYAVSTGQGLILWQGFQGNKAMALSKRSVHILKPYTSATENNFMRGVATNLGVNDWNLSLFISAKPIDANLVLDESSEQNQLAFSSIQTSGIHNTENLFEDKDAVKEKSAGFYINKTFNSGKVGLTGFHHTYDLPFKKPDNLYNYFSFEGNSYTNLGIDYQFHFKKFHFAGEQAYSLNSGRAYLHSASASLAPEFQLNLVHRYYSKDYFSHYSNAFGENSYVTNERGLYAGSTITLFSKLIIKNYLDLFRFPWLRYGVDKPSGGMEYMVEATYPIKTGMLMRVQHRYKAKDANYTSPENYLKSQVITEAMQTNMMLKYTFNEKWNGSNRIDYKTYNKDAHSEGWGILQDIHFQSVNKKFGITARLAYFKTNDFSSRFYVYENDIPYVFSIPAYFNEGFRYYFLMKVKPAKNTTLYLKAGQFTYLHASHLGTGPSTIDGNKKTEVKIQAIFRW